MFPSQPHRPLPSPTFPGSKVKAAMGFSWTEQFLADAWEVYAAAEIPGNSTLPVPTL